MPTARSFFYCLEALRTDRLGFSGLWGGGLRASQPRVLEFTRFQSPKEAPAVSVATSVEAVPEIPATWVEPNMAVGGGAEMENGVGVANSPSSVRL